MVRHVYERTKRAKTVDEVVVATDDQRVMDAVESFGGRALMTSPSCPTGTDRLAEAFAEHLHARVRREFWGYAADEAMDNEALISENYRGIRPAPGYPACPEHSEKGPLFELLQAPLNAGITITDSFAMLPTAAVSGFYFSHPQAQYFANGKVDKEQVTSYAKRKEWTMKQAERWLAPVLSY